MSSRSSSTVPHNGENQFHSITQLSEVAIARSQQVSLMASPISPRTITSEQRLDGLYTSNETLVSPFGYYSLGEEDERDGTIHSDDVLRTDHNMLIVSQSAEAIETRTSLGRPSITTLSKTIFHGKSSTMQTCPENKTSDLVHSPSESNTTIKMSLATSSSLSLPIITEISPPSSLPQSPPSRAQSAPTQKLPNSACFVTNSTSSTSTGDSIPFKKIVQTIRNARFMIERCDSEEPTKQWITTICDKIWEPHDHPGMSYAFPGRRIEFPLLMTDPSLALNLPDQINVDGANQPSYAERYKQNDEEREVEHPIIVKSTQPPSQNQLSLHKEDTVQSCSELEVKGFESACLSSEICEKFEKATVNLSETRESSEELIKHHSVNDGESERTNIFVGEQLTDLSNSKQLICPTGNFKGTARITSSTSNLLSLETGLPEIKSEPQQLASSSTSSYKNRHLYRKESMKSTDNIISDSKGVTITTSEVEMPGIGRLEKDETVNPNHFTNASEIRFSQTSTQSTLSSLETHTKLFSQQSPLRIGINFLNREEDTQSSDGDRVKVFTGAGIRIIPISQILSALTKNGFSSSSIGSSITATNANLLPTLSSAIACPGEEKSVMHLKDKNGMKNLDVILSDGSTAESTRAPSFISTDLSAVVPMPRLNDSKLSENLTAQLTGKLVGRLTQGLIPNGQINASVQTELPGLDRTTSASTTSSNSATPEGWTAKTPSIKLRSAQGTSIVEVEDWRPHGTQMLKRFVAKMRGSFENPFKPQPALPFDLLMFQHELSTESLNGVIERGIEEKQYSRPPKEMAEGTLGCMSSGKEADSVQRLKKAAAKFKSIKTRRRTADGRDKYHWRSETAKRKHGQNVFKVHCLPSSSHFPVHHYYRTGNVAAMGWHPMMQSLPSRYPFYQFCNLSYGCHTELARNHWFRHHDFHEVTGGAKNFLATIQKAFKYFDTIQPSRLNPLYVARNPNEPRPFQSHYRRLTIPSYQIPSLSKSSVPSYSQLLCHDPNPTHLPGCPLQYCDSIAGSVVSLPAIPTVLSSATPFASFDSTPFISVAGSGASTPVRCGAVFCRSVQHNTPVDISASLSCHELRALPGTGCLICQCLMAGQASLSALARASLTASFSTPQGLEIASPANYLQPPRDPSWDNNNSANGSFVSNLIDGLQLSGACDSNAAGSGKVYIATTSSNTSVAPSDPTPGSLRDNLSDPERQRIRNHASRVKVFLNLVADTAYRCNRYNQSLFGGPGICGASIAPIPRFAPLSHNVEPFPPIYDSIHSYDPDNQISQQKQSDFKLSPQHHLHHSPSGTSVPPSVNKSLLPCR